MRIVVTGGAGFVGSHLIKRLNGFAGDVINLDIKDGIDITDWRQLEKIKDVDVVIHLAAKLFVPDSFKDPQSFYYTNIIGTLNALELCRKNKAKLVFTSSYVYGNPQYLPIDEKHPTDPANPYAQTKLIGEQLCRSYNKDFGVSVIILRPFNIFGRGQNENFLIPTIMKQAKTGFVRLKDPFPKRDFVYIDDVIEAYIKAVELSDSQLDVFNIGSGKSYSVREIVNMIKELYQHKLQIVFNVKTRMNEISDSVADISKAKNILQWRPETNIQDGLKSIIWHS